MVAFLNALVMAAETRGYRIVKGNRALVFFVDDEALDFKIVEQTTRSWRIHDLIGGDQGQTDRR